MDFEQWLRAEIEHIDAIRKDQMSHYFTGNRRPALEAVAYANGRQRALKEAQLAYNRRDQ